MPKQSKHLIIAITSVLVLLTILKSLYFTNKNGGTDIRIRVIGSRLLTTDHSPYFYSWNPKDGEYFLSPGDDAGTLLNGNVVTPATLYLVYPVSWQSYPLVRISWTIIQFLLVVFCLYLLFKVRTDKLVFLYVCLLITGIVCTDIWLLNIDRGQIYIFYTFLFAVMYCLYVSKWKQGLFFSGFIGGIFILFRPFVLVTGLVFLLAGKKKWVMGNLFGIIAGSLFFVLPKPSLWLDYFEAMNMYASQFTGKAHYITNAIEYPKPAIIEGLKNLTEAQQFNISRLDILYNYLKRMGITVSQNLLYIIYGLMILLFSIYFLKAKEKVHSPTRMFTLAFLLYILAELFVTVPRGNYNLIQWLFPLALIISSVRLFQPLFILIIMGILLLHNFPFVIPYQAAFAELIFIWASIYYVFFYKSISQNADKTRLSQAAAT